MHERFMWLGISIFKKTIFSFTHVDMKQSDFFYFFMSNDYNPFTPFTTYLQQITCDHKSTFANIYHNTF